MLALFQNKIILCLDKDIDDLSYIFYKCESLISIEYYKINDSAHEKEEVNDYNSIFSYSKSIIILYPGVNFPNSQILSTSFTDDE